jgi:hypothetical protein
VKKEKKLKQDLFDKIGMFLLLISALRVAEA